MFKSLAPFLLFLAASGAFAQDQVLSSFDLAKPTARTLERLSRYFDLEHWDGDSVEIIASESQIPLLLKIAPTVKLKEADASAAARGKLWLYSIGKIAGRLGYHSLEEVQMWMQGLEAKNSIWIKVIQYGNSKAGRPLSALRINKSGEVKPVLMITAATHGDELITTEVMIALVNQLIEGAESNSRFAAMLDNHDLYFVPVVNPDGFTSVRRYDGNVDPNRSYPWPGNENAIPTPSIASLIQLFHQIQPVGTLDYHAYGELVMYPWAYTYDAIDAKFDVPFGKLCTSMAEHNGYTHGSISNVIYIAQGSSADYYFSKLSSASLAIEIGSDKIPDPSEFPEYVQSQAESLWRFIEAF